MARPEFFPEWATNDVNLPSTGSRNKERPRQTLREVGWDAGQIPTAEEFNWLLNNLCLWINYANDNVNTPYLQKSSNLSDLVSKTTARTNLDIYSKTEIDDAINAAKTEMQLKVGTVIGVDVLTTNPSEIYGYGTWVPFAEGRMLIGVGTTVDSAGVSRTFLDSQQGGEYSHTLTTAEMPTHSHDLFGTTGSSDNTDPLPNNQIAGESNGTGAYATNGQSGNKLVKDSGSSLPHNNLQPYQTIRYWKRTA